MSSSEKTAQQETVTLSLSPEQFQRVSAQANGFALGITEYVQRRIIGLRLPAQRSDLVIELNTNLSRMNECLAQIEQRLAKALPVRSLRQEIQEVRQILNKLDHYQFKRQR